MEQFLSIGRAHVEVPKRGAFVTIMKVRGAGVWLVASAALVTLPARAIEFSVSGFGTVGYARSNQAYTYQRVIDEDGTFARDSLAGLQLDAKFDEHFGGTVQFKYAPATNSDNNYTGTVSWAFLSWRPSNDWLFRAGKQRIPLYLYSQTVDVGVTYDFARLPTEMYSITTNNDFGGLSLRKTWAAKDGEVNLEGYWGKSNLDSRFWLRDNIPPVPEAMFPGQRAGATFIREDIKGGGLVLSYRRDEDTYRIGAARVLVTLPDDTTSTGVPVTGFPVTYPFVTLAPGIGYYQTDPFVYPTFNSIHVTVLTLGADVGLGSGYRFIGEFARTWTSPSGEIGVASTRGYVSLLKRIDQWTPYILYGFLRSQPAERNLYTAVNYNTVPGFIPNAALINASQRSGADFTFSFDQRSWAIGTAYSFSASSILKAEFLRTHVGEMSTLLDMPPGGNSRHQDINVFSLSYNLAF